MSVLSYIMSFYMLFLALYPCLDIEPAAQDDSQVVSISDSDLINPTPGEDEGEHDEGHCSPFCMCHCCHTHVVVSGPAKVVMLSTGLSPISHYLREEKQESIQSVFRPPILS